MGIYFGFLCGLGLYALKRGFSQISVPKTLTFVLVTAPLVIDALGNLFHIWSSSNWTRFLTGILWGLVLPFYFITGVADFFLNRNRKKAGALKNIP